MSKDTLKYFVISTDSSGNSPTLNYLYNNVNPKDIFIITNLDKGCEYYSHYLEAYVVVSDPTLSHNEVVERAINFAKNSEFSNIIILGDNDIINLKS